jgi:hypothetical protein
MGVLTTNTVSSPMTNRDLTAFANRSTSTEVGKISIDSAEVKVG